MEIAERYEQNAYAEWLNYNRFVGDKMINTPEYLERYKAERIKNLRK